MIETKDSWDMRGTTTTVARCYESHPALIVGTAKIYGGSCYSPIITDADVYVGFDGGMKQTKCQYPWEPQSTVVEFLYKITDMAAPSDANSFKKLIEYLMFQLADGKKVHCGCIGGHGRTGTVFAALVQAATGEKDAITFVRNHYCKKAVESAAQIDFLHKHFGITKVEGTKESWSSYSKGSKASTREEKWFGPTGLYPKTKMPPAASPVVKRGASGETYSIVPAANDKLTVWGRAVRLFDKPVKSGIISL